MFLHHFVFGSLSRRSNTSVFEFFRFFQSFRFSDQSLSCSGTRRAFRGTTIVVIRVDVDNGACSLLPCDMELWNWATGRSKSSSLDLDGDSSEMFGPQGEEEHNCTFSGASAGNLQGDVPDLEFLQPQDCNSDSSPGALSPDWTGLSLEGLWMPASPSPLGSESIGTRSKKGPPKRRRKRRGMADLTPKQMRKARQTNRISARKHREQAKQERLERAKRLEELLDHNTTLTSQVLELESETRSLRKLIIAQGLCRHGQIYL